jgi:hypothetical protein
MAKPTITNFRVQKLDNSKGALDLARKKWADAEFVPKDDYWLGHFDMNGETHAVGIRAGHRIDVAPDILQYSFQLNVRDEAFDNDTLIPEADVADILAALEGEFYKAIGRAPDWEKASLDASMKDAVAACLRGDRLIIQDSTGAVVYTQDGDARTVLIVRVDPAEFEARDCRKALDDAHSAYLDGQKK